MLRFQQPSYLASLIQRYIPTRALRSSSSRSVRVHHHAWQPPNHFHLLLQISGMHHQIICRPFQLFLFLEELSNIIYSCLLTLTVGSAKTGKIKPAQCITLRDTAPTTTTDIPVIAAEHGLGVHCYADDGQLYIYDKASATNNLISVVTGCIAEIDEWMSSNRLKLNADKTQFIWLGTRQQLRKVDSN